MMRRVGLASLVCAVAFMWSSEVLANTVTQNVSWTIDRAGTSAKYRVVGYGDSIYAGYHGSIWDVAIWSAPNVSGEYASTLWASDVEVIRRCKSGAVASDIYNSKIVGEKSYMQASSTRVVTSRCAATTASRRGATSPARAGPATTVRSTPRSTTAPPISSRRCSSSTRTRMPAPR